MVKVAISGGSGNVGQEVVDALVAAGKHEIIILSRKDGPPANAPVQPGVNWVKVDYGNIDDLTRALQGVEAVLCFIVVHMDPDNMAQKALIDASVRAGVKRFAPSEWCTPRMDHMPWLDHGKLEIRKYLEKVNKDTKVLEYCLFHPGLFANYLTHPHKSAEHLLPIATPVDFNNRRALILEGSDKVPISLTIVQDLAKVVATAIEYEGEWPRVGGVKGGELTMEQLLAVGEKARGAPFDVERLKTDDLKAGVLNSSWKPGVEHQSLVGEEADGFITTVVCGVILAIGVGEMQTSNEWNNLLPHVKLTGAGEFLSQAWHDKP